MNFDCLAPQGYGEIIGGSMREDSFEALVGRIKEEGYNQADYEWYLDLRALRECAARRVRAGGGAYGSMAGGSQAYSGDDCFSADDGEDLSLTASAFG